MSYEDKIKWVEDIKRKIVGMNLSCPREMLFVKNENLAEIINGCGSDHMIKAHNVVATFVNHIGEEIVPDSILGIVDMEPICCIHDYRYFVGTTEEERKFADEELKANALSVLRDTCTSPIERTLCRRIINIYYYAVRTFGKSSFQNKEKED